MATILNSIKGWFSNTPKQEELPDPRGAKEVNELLSKNAELIAPGIQDGRPVFSSWSTKRAINDGLKASTWVYAAASLKSRAIASVPFIVANEDGDVVVDSALGELLAHPNDFWTQQILMMRLMLHLQLGGNALIVKNRGGKPFPAPVLELWLVHPDQIKPVVDKVKVVSHYEYTSSQGLKKTIAVEDVIHIQLVDPGNPYWGLSVIEAASKTIDTEVEAQVWNKSAMANRAVSDGMFSFDRRLSREQWIEARMRIREQHMGAKNARMPWVMGEGVKWHSMQMSPVEMDFIQSRKMGREEICSVFGVPPVLIGDLERATYSNYQIARLAFWEDTVVPLLTMLEQALTLGLRNDFAELERGVIKADLKGNKILNQITPEKVQVAEGLQRMGVPFARINDRLNLGVEEFEGWDVSYLTTSIVPAAQVAIDQFAAMTEDDVKRFADMGERKLLGD